MSKIISVISPGHSGSTLLDFIIGSIPCVFSTGEVTYLPWQIHRRPEGPSSVTREEALAQQNVCSCLRTFRACDTWVQIINRISEAVGFDVYQDPFRFKIAIFANQRYVRPREMRWLKLLFHHLPLYYIPHRTIEYAMKKSALAPLAKLSKHLIRNRLKNNWLLFDTIGEVCGSQYVVDSSKDMLRLQMLHSFRPTDVRVILLVRDICGVAYSEIKRKGNPLMRARQWVSYYNRIMPQLHSIKNVNYHVVLYENLTRDPIGQRRRIAEYLDLPDPGDNIQIDTTKSHLVAGNPMRYRGKIDIKHDNAWQAEINESLRREIRDIGQALDKQLRKIIDANSCLTQSSV